MKRILSLGLAILMFAFLLTGCGEKDRILYKSVNLNKFVELADYKNIKVDTASDEFKKVYDSVVAADVEDLDLYVQKTEGKVAKGDTANIDYEGKKDGVAFEDGTAKGHDLEIGSNSFIDGFEEGLIGVEIGSTVDLNLTFPENYQSTDLAGKDVVFTVKVNYVKTKEAQKPEEYFGKMGFKTVEEYNKDVKERAISGYLIEKVLEKSKVKNYPEADVEILKEKFTDIMEKNLKSYYGMTLADYISQTGSTQESFDKQLLDEQVYPLMSENMPLYAIIDEEKVEVTASEIDGVVKDMLEDYGEDANVTAEQLKEYYGEYYFENILVSEKAVEILKKYADIK
ncbi:MAG: FKBP-type peptidyl-prolyl cis-trans isomerase [Clostridia bacterium]|nr:FKBP-type peptidyl-prolyl cis-trans isomerase [Clostridia bacterium]